MAKRAAAREKGERHVLNGYKICCGDRGRLGFFSPDIFGSCIYYNTTNTGWQLERVVGLAEDAESKSLPHTIEMLELGKQYNVRLSKGTLTNVGDQRGVWYWHVHERTKSAKDYAPSLK